MNQFFPYSDPEYLNKPMIKLLEYDHSGVTGVGARAYFPTLMELISVIEYWFSITGINLIPT